ncbi:MAG: endonuclease/exonuclease/phosphatase family protein [Myxococcota bacterium]
MFSFRNSLIFLNFFCISLNLISCDPFNAKFDDVEKARFYQASNLESAPENPPVLKVMNWNVKFGGGRIDFFFDCHGDRVLMKKHEVITNLEGLAAKIRKYEPHLLFIQEVDILSKRSAYVNQVKWLLENTSLNYGVYASQWKVDYVPSDGVGKVDSGNAILSKYEFNEAIRLALPLISSQDALTSYFYLRRNILKTSISLAGKDLYLLNIHTSAYSKDGTKKKQIDRLFRELEQLETDNQLFIVAGDFNTIPPGSEQISGFPDSVCTDDNFTADDYTDETNWLDDFYQHFNSAVPLSKYQADNSPYFTHTTNKNGFWNRKLDYIFTNGDFVPDSEKVHQGDEPQSLNTMELSDHAPVTVSFSLE